MAIARLNDDLKYICFMQIPENGVNSYTDSSENMVKFFETLADKDAIDIIIYLGSGIRNRMQSLEVISGKLGIPLSKVSIIMDKLDRLGLVWRVSAEIADASPIVCGYVNSVPLVFILTLAKSLIRYVTFHDLYIDTWEKGPFAMPDIANTSPIPEFTVPDAQSEKND